MKRHDLAEVTSSNWPQFFLGALLVLAGLLLDQVVLPRMLMGFTGFRFLEATVALCGIRGGLWRGVLAGWLAGALLASLTTEYVGFSIMHMALLGAGAGLCSGMASLNLPWLEAGMVLALLLVDSIVSGLVGWMLWSATPSIEYVGIPITALALGAFRTWFLFIARRPRTNGSRMI
ncbi:TPA: hypothetical protein DDW35_04680 [Candidatus Sumerlaeota bacterium]|nr:hypothetical protein [Candidatus Sumerlaeota bacterium]